ncbi:MAG: xanthine dehydrogenase family protein molybdopterin-binding subunit, partial [Umezawaea sp.]
MTSTPDSSATRAPFVGRPVDRVDAVLKVTGGVGYPADAAGPSMLHAAVVQAVVPAGRVRGVDTAQARTLPGVVRVFTPFDAPTIVRGPDTMLGPAPRPLLQDDEIQHHGQVVALVLAETPEQAHDAASLVVVDVEPSRAVLGWDEATPETHPGQDMESQQGDVDTALARAEVTLDESYETAATSNNPIGLFTTYASWTDGSLTV